MELNAVFGHGAAHPLKLRVNANGLVPVFPKHLPLQTQTPRSSGTIEIAAAARRVENGVGNGDAKGLELPVPRHWPLQLWRRDFRAQTYIPNFQIALEIFLIVIP